MKKTIGLVLAFMVMMPFALARINVVDDRTAIENICCIGNVCQANCEDIIDETTTTTSTTTTTTNNPSPKTEKKTHNSNGHSAGYWILQKELKKEIAKDRCKVELDRMYSVKETSMVFFTYMDDFNRCADLYQSKDIYFTEINTLLSSHGLQSIDKKDLAEGVVII